MPYNYLFLSHIYTYLSHRSGSARIALIAIEHLQNDIFDRFNREHSFASDV